MTRTLHNKMDRPGNPKKLEELTRLFNAENSSIIDLRLSPSFTKRTGFSKLAWEAFLRALDWGNVIDFAVADGVWTVEKFGTLPTSWSDPRPGNRLQKKAEELTSPERVHAAKCLLSGLLAEEQDPLAELRWALEIARKAGFTVVCTVTKTVVEETDL